MSIQEPNLTGVPGLVVLYHINIVSLRLVLYSTPENTSTPQATSVSVIDLMGEAPHYQRLVYSPITRKMASAWRS